MTQMDIICELEILTENDNNRIIIRFVLCTMSVLLPFNSSIEQMHSFQCSLMLCG